MFKKPEVCAKEHVDRTEKELEKDLISKKEYKNTIKVLDAQREVESEEKDISR